MFWQYDGTSSHEMHFFLWTNETHKVNSWRDKNPDDPFPRGRLKQRKDSASASFPSHTTHPLLPLIGPLTPEITGGEANTTFYPIEWEGGENCTECFGDKWYIQIAVPEYCPDRNGLDPTKVCNYSNVVTSEEFQLNAAGPNAIEVENLITEYREKGWNLGFLKSAAASVGVSSWAAIGVAGAAALAVVL